jgi:antitoxin component of MazEF toxin-antitoxin module
MLTRKARKVGSSLVVTIPSQMAEFYDIVDGTMLEIIFTKQGEFTVKKIKEPLT